MVLNHTQEAFEVKAGFKIKISIKVNVQQFLN